MQQLQARHLMYVALPRHGTQPAQLPAEAAEEARNGCQLDSRRQHNENFVARKNVLVECLRAREQTPPPCLLARP